MLGEAVDQLGLILARKQAARRGEVLGHPGTIAAPNTLAICSPSGEPARSRSVSWLPYAERTKLRIIARTLRRSFPSGPTSFLGGEPVEVGLDAVAQPPDERFEHLLLAAEAVAHHAGLNAGSLADPAQRGSAHAINSRCHLRHPAAHSRRNGASGDGEGLGPVCRRVSERPSQRPEPAPLYTSTSSAVPGPREPPGSITPAVLTE